MQLGFRTWGHAHPPDVAHEREAHGNANGVVRGRDTVEAAQRSRQRQPAGGQEAGGPEGDSGAFARAVEQQRGGGVGPDGNDGHAAAQLDGLTPAHDEAADHREDQGPGCPAAVQGDGERSTHKGVSVVEQVEAGVGAQRGQLAAAGAQPAQGGREAVMRQQAGGATPGSRSQRRCRPRAPPAFSIFTW